MARSSGFSLSDFNYYNLLHSQSYDPDWYSFQCNTLQKEGTTKLALQTSWWTSHLSINLFKPSKDFDLDVFSEFGFDVAFGTRPKNIEDRYGTIKLFFINVDNYINEEGVSGKLLSVRLFQ